MKLLVAVLSIVFLMGCVALQPSPSVCTKPEAEDSIICQMASRMGTTPEQLDFVIRLGTAIALDKNPDKAGEALRYLDKVSAVLDGSGVTYNDLAVVLKDKPLTFVVAQEVLDQFSGLELPTGTYLPISEFDLNLLKIHIERQTQLVMLGGE